MAIPKIGLLESPTLILIAMNGVVLFSENYPYIIEEFLKSTSDIAYLVELYPIGVKMDKGPLAWNMFVSLNYKTKVHDDMFDASKYTCAVVSNTNKGNRGGEFYILSHNVKFNLLDGDFFLSRK